MIGPATTARALCLVLALLAALILQGCAYGGDKRWGPKGELLQARRTIALFSGNVSVLGGEDDASDITLNKEANLGPVLRDLSHVVNQLGRAYTGTSAGSDPASWGAGSLQSAAGVPYHVHPAPAPGPVEPPEFPFR